ncbi:hypothetical protein B0H11DRAFT_1885203 [Mycena galericulata]|nr:hypothetical protein B0H11DRAFT_1885203 [Mycena galericulata]
MDLYNIPEPGLDERLRCNLLPSDTERKAIIDSLTTADRRISEIRAQSVAVSSAEEDMLCRYITDYSSLIAPVRRLPDDILETIFLDLHEFVNVGQVTPSLVVDKHNPHILASVSRHWRCVALHTVRRWSSVYVDGTRGQYSLRVLRLCLERSRGAGLSITLDLSPNLPPNMEILNEIMAHAERWVHFSLITPPDTRHLLLFAPVRGRLASLEKIEIKFTWGYDSGAIADLDVFEHAPRLETLELDTFLGYHIPPLPFH